MASTSKRQQRPPCLPSAALCALVVAASLGSALVRCQTGGFGSPSPGPGQCDASGPRQECGASADPFFMSIDVYMGSVTPSASSIRAA